MIRTMKRRRVHTRDGPEQPVWSARAEFPAEVHCGDVQEVVAALSSLSSVAEETAAVLHHEHWILQRLIYRNSSQHRRSDHFQKLLKLGKMLGRLEALQLAREAEAAVATWPSGRLVHMNLCDEEMPSHSILAYNLRRFQDAAALLDAMAMHCTVTFVSVHHRIAKALFMPLNLTFASLVSRVAAVAKHLRSAVAAAYATVRPCIDWVEQQQQQQQQQQARDGGEEEEEFPWTLPPAPVPSMEESDVVDAVDTEVDAGVEETKQDANLAYGDEGVNSDGYEMETRDGNAANHAKYKGKGVGGRIQGSSGAGIASAGDRGLPLAAEGGHPNAIFSGEMDGMFLGSESVVIKRSDYRGAKRKLKSKQKLKPTPNPALQPAPTQPESKQSTSNYGSNGSSRSSSSNATSSSSIGMFAAVTAAVVSDDDNDDNDDTDDGGHNADRTGQAGRERTAGDERGCGTERVKRCGGAEEAKKQARLLEVARGGDAKRLNKMKAMAKGGTPGGDGGGGVGGGAIMLPETGIGTGEGAVASPRPSPSAESTLQKKKKKKKKKNTKKSEEILKVGAAPPSYQTTASAATPLRLALPEEQNGHGQPLPLLKKKKKKKKKNSNKEKKSGNLDVGSGGGGGGGGSSAFDEIDDIFG